MVTREELSYFAEFCKAKYKIDLKTTIIDDFIKNLKTEEELTIENQILDDHYHIGCSSNNIECTHLTFDSSKCIECPY